MHRQFEFFMVRKLCGPEELTQLSSQGSVFTMRILVWEPWGREHKHPISLLQFETAWATYWLWNAHSLEKHPVMLASQCQEHSCYQPSLYSQAEGIKLWRGSLVFSYFHVFAHAVPLHPECYPSNHLLFFAWKLPFIFKYLKKIVVIFSAIS